jgi:23S rRNA (uracil1939-C5)-methyltransferase
VSRPVEVQTRDLFHRPLLPAELAGFDAVVLDPPRAGAEAQTHALAASSVPQIVSIACDAQSFARDAAFLIAAGYQPVVIEPIDQFRFSAHMEIFSLFRRTLPKKKRRLLG